MEVVVFHQLGAGKMVGMQGAVLVAGKTVGVERAGLAQKDVVADQLVGVDVAVLAQKDVVADQMVGVEGALVQAQMVGVEGLFVAQDMAGAMVGVVLVVLASLRRWASSMEEPLSAPAAAHQQGYHTAHHHCHYQSPTMSRQPPKLHGDQHLQDTPQPGSFDASDHETRLCTSSSNPQNHDAP